MAQVSRNRSPPSVCQVRYAVANVFLAADTSLSVHNRGSYGGVPAYRTRAGEPDQVEGDAPALLLAVAAVGLLIPFIVRLPNNNEVAMRGVIPAQVGVTLAGCYVLTLWEKRHRRLVTALVALQVILTTVVAGIHSNRIISFADESVPASSRWISRNTPFNALVFYEQDPATSIWTKLIEPIYGQRLSYVEWPVFWDWNMTPAQQFAWNCLPKVNLYAADSLCAIEANIPGEQPVYVSYLAPPSSLDAAYFEPLHQSAGTAIFSLTCPVRDFPKYEDPPMWMRAL